MTPCRWSLDTRSPKSLGGICGFQFNKILAVLPSKSVFPAEPRVKKMESYKATNVSLRVIESGVTPASTF